MIKRLVRRSNKEHRTLAPSWTDCIIDVAVLRWCLMESKEVLSGRDMLFDESEGFVVLVLEVNAGYNSVGGQRVVKTYWKAIGSPGGLVS